MKITLIETDATLEDLREWKNRQLSAAWIVIPIKDFPIFLHPALLAYEKTEYATYNGMKVPALTRQGFLDFFEGAWSLYPIKFRIDQS